ncbi:TMEM175 family protein [Planotetraspora kaengkrachanensis]|uniref:DUF1211 domain-containing protein n=1 Tax=Planotetraspora kaengkrachanensis TaxID=575193 RepID=A0A8J3PTU6_9ACTN|nr:TMEM175 family protein [Planotetraspora kaengkrachanensis]GIG80930.1 hypothetical protein Pka01_40570 [Planotetraspora kaengkrachanensis]
MTADGSEAGSPTGPPTGHGGEGFAQAGTGRVEAFSDAVFAIAMTILALEMRTPDHPSGGLLPALWHQWPVYLGYLTSFAYIGVIWLNHHQAFTRVRVVDRSLHAANLTLLLTTAALAFPTAVVSDAVQSDIGGADARTAVALYALIAAAMCASWRWIYIHLARRPDLLTSGDHRRYIRHGRMRSSTGVVGYALGGALGWFVHPAIALGLFLLLPIFYFATSEGLPRLSRRGG